MAENTMQPATAAQLHFLKLLKREGYLEDEEMVRNGSTV
jgi:ribosomal protein S8